MRTNDLHAVLDEEISGVLASLGLLEDVERGDIQCAHCGVVLTAKSIAAIAPDGNRSFSFYCDNFSCIAFLRADK